MLICVVHDISLRKRIERLKRDFVSMVSHDLRTPLTSIQMVLSLLQEEAYGKLTATGHARLSETENNVQRLISLVNGLLTLDKMESGVLAITLSPTTIDEIIDPAISAVSGFALKHSVRITVCEHPNYSLTADKDRLTKC